MQLCIVVERRFYRAVATKLCYFLIKTHKQVYTGLATTKRITLAQIEMLERRLDAGGFRIMKKRPAWGRFVGDGDEGCY